MKTDQTSSNPVHSPVIAGASTSGLGWGIFDAMNEELLKKLADIIQTESDLIAIQSLIEERKMHRTYRELDREFYFGRQAQKGEEEA
jgi:hypothetical protein